MLRFSLGFLRVSADDFLESLQDSFIIAVTGHRCKPVVLHLRSFKRGVRDTSLLRVVHISMRFPRYCDYKIRKLLRNHLRRKPTEFGILSLHNVLVLLLVIFACMDTGRRAGWSQENFKENRKREGGDLLWVEITDFFILLYD